jgi:hypothetical protein
MASYELSHAVWRTSSYSGVNGVCVEVAVVSTWRTSSHSGQNGDCVEVAVLEDTADWRTSSRSGQSGSCVEVARNLPGVVAVRDSKDRSGATLMFGPADWEKFTRRIRAGELS